jgi:hypothetical protein
LKDYLNSRAIYLIFGNDIDVKKMRLKIYLGKKCQALVAFQKYFFVAMQTLKILKSLHNSSALSENGCQLTATLDIVVNVKTVL